jgi:LPS-assembly protein
MFPNGGQIEGLVGGLSRADLDRSFEQGTGLDKRAADWVGRLRLAPVPWFELVGRSRLDSDTLEPRFWDATARSTPGASRSARLSADRSGAEHGDPEARGGLGRHLHQPEPELAVGAFGRYDLAIERPVAAQLVAAYEDECLIFETRFVRAGRRRRRAGTAPPTRCGCAA